MGRIDGCDCKVKRTRLVWIVDWLLLTTVWHFISTTKLLVACLFAYMVVMCVRGENLLAWFAPMVVTVFCANSLFWGVRLFLSRQ